MLHQDTDAFPTVGVPDEEFPSVAVAVARGYPPVIETPGHACDNSLVSHQPEQKPVTPGIPHIAVTIFARTAQPQPIGTPGHLTDRACLRLVRSTLQTGRHIPHTHALQHGSAGQRRTLGTPGQTYAAHGLT